MGQGGVDVTACLKALSRRLVDAAAIAHAALARARRVSRCEAVGVSMQLDLLLGEAQTLHRAVCLLSRKEAPRTM